MQQRQPRLGDIVDDYCPRERRITNHAVVAMVGDEVRQTRCTTCDSDHEFKQAKVPPQRRKKEVTGALYQQVLAGMPRKVVPPGLDPPPDSSDDAGLMVETESEVIPEEPAEVATPVAVAVDEVDGPVHRPLIRATLPRLNDDPPQRREPDFTMRSPAGPRPGKFGKNGFRGHRPGGHGGHQPNGNRAANGNREGSGNFGPSGKRHHGHGPHRPGGGRPGPSPHGSGRGPRPGGHGRGGKKSPR